jgi:hypothetical protein
MEMTHERRCPSQQPRGFFIKLSVAEADRLCALLFLVEFILLGALLAHAVWDLLGGGGFSGWWHEPTMLTSLASIQIFIVGILCIIIARPGRDAELFPWSPFWLVGVTLVLVSGCRTLPFLDSPGFIDGAQLSLVLLLALSVNLIRKAGGLAPLLRLWRCFQGDLSIFLVGGWIVLVGSVGLEVLYGYYRAPVALAALQPLFKAFLEVAGASVMLYGALLLLLNQQYPEKNPHS